MPNGLVEIQRQLFDGCSNLQTVNIPASVEHIRQSAFFQCSNLKSVVLPSALKDIEWGAFYGNHSLKSIAYNSISKIGDHNIFVECPNDAIITLSLTDDSYVYTEENPQFPSGSRRIPLASATYTRSIAASSNWGTLVLPFGIASDENVQLYELSDVSSEAMTFSQVDQVAANTPCVFKKKNAAATSLTLAAADVNVTATAAPSVNSIGDWTVKGTYERLTDQTGMFYIAQDGFWYAENPISIKPFRAWFENSVSQAKAFSIFEQENDTEDAIQALEEMTNNTAEYYDLNGRRMDGLQKGINIIKYGQDKTKKVIIK